MNACDIMIEVTVKVEYLKYSVPPWDGWPLSLRDWCLILKHECDVFVLSTGTGTESGSSTEYGGTEDLGSEGN